MNKLLSSLSLATLLAGVTANATSFNGHVYSLTPTASDWNSAEAYAVSIGGHLVTINDAPEQVFLAATFTQASLWIGFNDILSEGTWVWSSGEPVTYTNWGGGEPNNLGNEDAAVMNWSLEKWNDLGTTFQGFGIVEVVPPDNRVPDGGSTAMLLACGVMGLSVLRRKLKG